MPSEICNFAWNTIEFVIQYHLQSNHQSIIANYRVFWIGIINAAQLP